MLFCCYTNIKLEPQQTKNYYTQLEVIDKAGKAHHTHVDLGWRPYTTREAGADFRFGGVCEANILVEIQKVKNKNLEYVKFIVLEPITTSQIQFVQCTLIYIW